MVSRSTPESVGVDIRSWRDKSSGPGGCGVITPTGKMGDKIIEPFQARLVMTRLIEIRTIDLINKQRSLDRDQRAVLLWTVRSSPWMAD